MSWLFSTLPSSQLDATHNQVPFIKKLKFQNFACPHAVFSGRGPKIKIPLPTFFLSRPPVSKKVWHHPPAPKPPEGPGVRVTCPKITCEELSGPWKFCVCQSKESKVTALFCSDTQTHENESPHHHNIIFFDICEGEGGKHHEPYKISTSSLCERQIRGIIYTYVV